ncbi:MAG: DMT family transporter [Chloroflexi bacterium]|nr:DMT family transporter [Chloroflexota bacterium]
MERRDWSGTALTVLAGVSFGALPLFVTWLSRAGVGVGLQVAVRLVVSIGVFATILARVSPGNSRPVSLRQWALVAFNGLLMVSAFTTYVLSIALGTPPAKAILLVYLYPVFVALIGSRALGERLTWRRGLGIAAGVAGAAVMVEFWTIRSLGQVQVGDFFALANCVVYAGVVVLGRRGSVREQMRPLVLTMWSFIFGLGWLCLGGLAMKLANWGGEVFLGLPQAVTLRTLGDFLGIAIFGTAIPYGLMFAGLSRTEATTASVLLLVEPISVIVMSMLFLGQSVSLWQGVGGAVILCAALLASR